MAHRSDYLVVGAGASALAFVDSVYHETEATFTIVDRRDMPGGHWNDAYPFVQLHQPAWMYGVASLPFGSLEVEQVGPNCGLTPLASGPQVAAHFYQFMHDTLLPSGRVKYLPLTEWRGDGRCVSLLSGETTVVEADTLVDATLMEAIIPLTHTPSFEVAPGAVCVPPNSLARVAPQHEHFAVLGAGKTAMDVVIWLLTNGARPDQVTWARPRDAWLFCRETFQPGAAFLRSMAQLLARRYEAAASATSIDDLAMRLEEAGTFCRLDARVFPEMFHGATVSPLELSMAREVADVVRAGHVKAVEPDRLVLEGGVHPLPAETLVIDCTAAGLGKNVGVIEPVFSPGRIALQMIRQYQPTFSSALIGHIEATIPDEAERARLTRVTPMTDTVADWVAGELTTIANQAAWAANPVVQAWQATCRLDVASTWNPDNPSVDAQAAVASFRARVPAAAKNLARLSPVRDELLENGRF
ncbi:hypothetical protein ACQP1W_44620 [Spirillospora sp. CA-255316]